MNLIMSGMIFRQLRNLTTGFPILILAIMYMISGCRKSDPASAEATYQEKYNQVYGNDTLQQYDLFLPEGRGRNTKTILLLHGGAWVAGDKWSNTSYAKSFAALGFAAVSMNYRLANDSVNYRAMLDDIDSMIVCIATHSAEWGIGNGHLALFGYSAGGHLALLYSYSRDMENKVTAVVSLAGPTDVQDSLLWNSPGLYDNIRLMTGDSLPANWALVSPVHFINATNPATMLIHGTSDSVVPVSQSIRLCQLPRSQENPVTLLLLENETHGFTAAATERFLEETKAFLYTSMK
jgi:acetyl esterase/lipase